MDTMTKYVLTGSAAALLGTAMAASAQANYLGYANGDPANWGFYEEQHNGASPPETAVAPPTYDDVGPHHARIEYRGEMYRRYDAERPSRY